MLAKILPVVSSDSIITRCLRDDGWAQGVPANPRWSLLNKTFYMDVQAVPRAAAHHGIYQVLLPGRFVRVQEVDQNRASRCDGRSQPAALQQTWPLAYRRLSLVVRSRSLHP